VDLPLIGDEAKAEVRDLIRPTGELDFVPLPPGEGVQAGDTLPAGLQPLFGREGVASVARGVTQVGQAVLDLTLTDSAAIAFDDYAADHFGEQFAIVSDGIVLSAPTIQARSFEGKMQMSGGFDESQVQRLLAILQLPALPGTLLELSFGPVGPPPGCPAR
jgi:preprotein translocase subunit SecD